MFSNIHSLVFALYCKNIGSENTAQATLFSYKHSLRFLFYLLLSKYLKMAVA